MIKFYNKKNIERFIIDRWDAPLSYLFLSISLFLSLLLFSTKQCVANGVDFSMLLDLSKQVSTSNSGAGVDPIQKVLQQIPGMNQLPYVVVKKSKSSQATSPDSPRIIAYNPKSNFIFAFNGGHSHGLGNQTIETIEFNSKEGRFIFREIPLPYQGQPIKENPEKCQACHDQKPIWESYFLWPNLIGAVEDDITGDSYFTQFEEMRSKPETRYGVLGHLDKNARAYWQTHSHRYAFESKTSPNFTFGAFLSDLNRERIKSLIQKDPRISPLRYAIIGAIECQDTPIQKFLPVSLRGQIRLSYEDYFKETLQLNRDDFDRRFIEIYSDPKIPQNRRAADVYEGHQKGKEFKRKLHPTDRFSDNEDSKIISRLRYLVEGLGGNLNWSMSFNRKAYALSDGTYFWDDWEKQGTSLFEPHVDADLHIAFQRKIMEDNPLSFLSSEDDEPKAPPFCEQLEAKSLKTLQQAISNGWKGFRSSSLCSSPTQPFLEIEKQHFVIEEAVSPFIERAASSSDLLADTRREFGFFEGMNEKGARELLLLRKIDHSYLLRSSSQGGDSMFTLSTYQNGRVNHIRMKKNKDSISILGSSIKNLNETYPNLNALLTQLQLKHNLGKEVEK